MLPYMVTWILLIYPSHVSIYTSTMDPMGIAISLKDPSSQATIYYGSLAGGDHTGLRLKVETFFFSVREMSYDELFFTGY